MKFFTFSQNNSGGFWAVPAQYLIVQADDADDANDIAQDNGVYFNGCAKNWDCDCCGDRWYTQCDDGDATDTPLIYGQSPADFKPVCSSKKVPKAIVIYNTGDVKTFV